GEPLCGRLHPDKHALLYAARSDEVQSSALLALEGTGLVAVGSADPNRFYPGMGTLFLRMMGEAFEGALRRFDGRTAAGRRACARARAAATAGGPSAAVRRLPRPPAGGAPCIAAHARQLSPRSGGAGGVGGGGGGGRRRARGSRRPRLRRVRAPARAVAAPPAAAAVRGARLLPLAAAARPPGGQSRRWGPRAQGAAQAAPGAGPGRGPDPGGGADRRPARAARPGDAGTVLFLGTAPVGAVRAALARPAPG